MVRAGRVRVAGGRESEMKVGEMSETMGRWSESPRGAGKWGVGWTMSF